MTKDGAGVTEKGDELPSDHRAFTPARQVAFCDHLSTTGNVRTACARVGTSPQTAYRTKRREAVFAAAWEGALLLARDHAEAVLACRALEGVDEPVFYHGEEVARRRRYDPRLLLAHLARLDARVEDGAAAQSLASVAAERFDAVLAALGGYEADPDLVEHAQTYELECATVAGLEKGALGTGRAAWVADAEEAAFQAMEAEVGAPDAEPGDGPKEGTAGDLPNLTCEEAAAEAGAEWDEHFGTVCAHVDAACGAVCDLGPDESAEDSYLAEEEDGDFGGLDGEGECEPGGGEDLSDGGVTSVTLPDTLPATLPPAEVSRAEPSGPCRGRV